MTVKVKEINFGMSELEAIIAGLRLLSDTPQETWSQYVTQREHLEELVTILKTLEVTTNYSIRCGEVEAPSA